MSKCMFYTAGEFNGYSQSSSLDFLTFSDAAVLASSAETTTSCDTASGAKSLKRPANSQRAMLAKTQSHGKLVMLRYQNGW